MNLTTAHEPTSPPVATAISMNPEGSQKVAGGRAPETPGKDAHKNSTPAGVPDPSHSSAVAIRSASQKPITSGTWDRARSWLNAAANCERAKLFCQVMLGFELITLQKTNGVGLGNNQHGRISHDGKSSSGAQAGPATFESILHRETGLPQSTAYRFMDMARAAIPRLKRFPALKSFDPITQPVAALPDTDKGALHKALQKLTDGFTQKSFAESLGLWKKPPGNPNAKGQGRRKLSDAEKAAQLRAFAMECSANMGKAVDASNHNFFLLTESNDLEVQAQIALLEHALSLRHAWLKQPKGKRDPKAIEQMLKKDWK